MSMLTDTLLQICREYPSRGDALIGGDKDHPRIVLAASGGSDLVYMPDSDREPARKIVASLVPS